MLLMMDKSNLVEVLISGTIDVAFVWIDDMLEYCDDRMIEGS